MNIPKPNEKLKPTEASASRLSFEGTSPNGDIAEALKDALKKAADAFGKTTVPWKLERIGGDQLGLAPISARIQAIPGEGEGGVGPHGQ